SSGASGAGRAARRPAAGGVTTTSTTRSDAMGCCSTAMGGMPLSGQAWPGAAAAFLAMWMVMMVPMMLPSLVPMLWRYRKAVSRTGGTHLAGPTALVGAGDFLVLVGVGGIAFPLGAALAEVEMRQAALAGAVPFAAGGVVLIAGALQFTAWKRRRLACCREAPGADGARGDAVAALRHGVHLGLRCGRCCLNLMLVGLVL